MNQICIALAFIITGSQVSPGPTWEQALIDGANQIMVDNSCPIYFYRDDDDTLALPIYWQDGSSAYGLGHTGNKVEMFNHMFGEPPVRLFTHEIMHALGLIHPWGMCQIYMSGPACDDRLEDTPPEVPGGEPWSTNLMSYTDGTNLTPMQLAAVIQHLTTDTSYTGMYWPIFGLSVKKWAKTCNTYYSTQEAAPAECARTITGYYDLLGRSLQAPPLNTIYLELWRDCTGKQGASKRFKFL